MCRRHIPFVGRSFLSIQPRRNSLAFQKPSTWLLSHLRCTKPGQSPVGKTRQESFLSFLQPLRTTGNIMHFSFSSRVLPQRPRQIPARVQNRHVTPGREVALVHPPTRECFSLWNFSIVNLLSQLSQTFRNTIFEICLGFVAGITYYLLLYATSQCKSQHFVFIIPSGVLISSQSQATLTSSKKL